MTQSGPTRPAQRNWRGLPIAAWVGLGAVVALLVAGGAFFALSAHPGSGPGSGPGPAVPGATTSTPLAGSGGAAASAGAATGTASASAGSTSTAGGSGSGAGSSAGGSGGTKRAKPPAASDLAALTVGEWRLYGARVISPGTVLDAGTEIDVNSIQLECDGVTKAASGGGYGHAVFDLAFSATGPSKGSGPWKLYGTWALVPDGTAADKQHYAEGVTGAMSGRSTARPPSSAGTVVASMMPVGAFRPGGGAIVGGTFRGTSGFDGTLFLPSVPAPPASKL